MKLQSSVQQQRSFDVRISVRKRPLQKLLLVSSSYYVGLNMADDGLHGGGWKKGVNENPECFLTTMVPCNFWAVEEIFS